MDESLSKRQKLVDSELVSKYFKPPSRLQDEFFNVPCLDLAKNLLGTILVRRLVDGTILKGKIVETECYLGADDKASFSYNGRRTARNEPMFMEPGTIFVYQTYGMYHCLNISSQGRRIFISQRNTALLETYCT
jgi:DNA-3-methyladenine glycosylase